MLARRRKRAGKCEKLTHRNYWRGHEHTGDTRDGRENTGYSVGPRAISLAENGSGRQTCGVSGWAGGHAGAATSAGSGSELFDERKREHVWRIFNEPTHERNDFGGARGDGGLFQLRGGRGRLWAKHDDDHDGVGPFDWA